VAVIPAVEAMLMTAPPPQMTISGMANLQK
jgi:hypothetical protein